MKFTHVLWKQHLGRMIKRHWFAHGQQILGETGSEAALLKKNIEVIDAKDLFLKKPHSFPRPDVNELLSACVVRRAPEKDDNHQDWKERPCLQHNTDDILIQGTDQAQLLTKTLIVSDTLPDKIENLMENTSEELDNILTKIIYTSNIFDAHQQTLPKKKDPLRPAWVFPRELGVGDVRKSSNLARKIIQLCELLSGSQLAQKRQLIHNGVVQIKLEKEGDLLMFNSVMDTMIMSSNGLKSIRSAEEDTLELTFPNIHPLIPTISLQDNHHYKEEELYPVSQKSLWKNVHTLFIYHDSEKVKNLTELPVTENQLLSRSLMKSFVAAAANAKQNFGSNVKDLPEPITVQCVQTNSQSFHFSVFQLNTLNIDGTDGTCNLWWSMPQINLFEKAEYVVGKPTVINYNPEVFKRILAFYRNI